MPKVHQPRVRTVSSHPAARREAIGILVAMESRIAREGVVSLLRTQKDFRVLGVAGTSAETLSLCIELRPRVLILGTLIPWPPEISGFTTLLLSVPETRILAVAPHGGDRCALLNPHPPHDLDEWLGEGFNRSTCLQLALSRGALGAVNQDTSLEDFVRAVRAVAAGRPWVAPGIAITNGGRNLLSSRERAVARLVGQGCSNKEISRALGITELTAKKHVANILRKLGFHDRLQLGLCVARNPLAFGSDSPIRHETEPSRRR